MNESKSIEKILSLVKGMLKRTHVAVAPFLVGINARAGKINKWLRKRSIDVDIALISGMGGIGKTTIAKFVYDQNFKKFDGSSFLAEIREVSKQPNGLVQLQRQFLSDIGNGRKNNIHNIDEGLMMIKDVVSSKRLLIVLDDVAREDQFVAILGIRKWFYPGSKIIITTRNEHLLNSPNSYMVYKPETLGIHESFELLSWHAFGQTRPFKGYEEHSRNIVHHCKGLPLTLKVLGNLYGKSIDEWKSTFEKLKEIPDDHIFRVLKISFDSLDDNDKNVFLHIACFFIGKDKDFIIEILDGCDLYTVLGIQNLIDRGLLTISKSNKIVMHPVLRDMGREIVRQESSKEPGQRSRLWHHKDSFTVLRQNTGSEKIEGLVLDMLDFKGFNPSQANFNLHKAKKLRSQELSDESLLEDQGSSLKQHALGLYQGDDFKIINDLVVETKAFGRMKNLRILQLGFIEISGSYEKFPKELTWLCWRGFPLDSIPTDFPVESLVSLDMSCSNVIQVWKESKFLGLLKTLNLSHCHNLVKTPDFLVLPNLERLILKDCRSLLEVDESIGNLKRLLFLNLKYCRNLRTLPQSIVMLKSLETLIISGCLRLVELPTQLRMLESLKVFEADGISINQLLPTAGEIQSSEAFSVSLSRRNPQSLCASLPPSSQNLYLRYFYLSDDALPEDFISLSESRISEKWQKHMSTEKFLEHWSHSTALLRVLDLSYTSIMALPSSISELVSLEKLFLRCCELLIELPPEIGELFNLQVLDLDKTEIMYLPKEIKNLSRLEQLKVCFYGYGKSFRESKQISERYPRGALSKLTKLEELSIDVNPDDEEWIYDVEVIIYDLKKIKTLRSVGLYLPKDELLGQLTPSSFKFIVGEHKQRLIFRIPHEVEEEFKKRDKSLRYINGESISTELVDTLKHTRAYFLDRHWTIKKLSEFGSVNLAELKLCLLSECNELETILDEDEFHKENYKHEFPFDVRLGALEYLGLYYLRNLTSICKGPIGISSLSHPKYLSLRTCTSLTYVFTFGLLKNLENLEELVFEDCPKIKSLVSKESPSMEFNNFLPSLKKMSLLGLPALNSISNGICIAPRLERLVVFYCPKLERLSTRELSCEHLKVLKGESEWWDSLKCDDWSCYDQDDFASIFVPLRRDRDLKAQFTKDDL